MKCWSNVACMWIGVCVCMCVLWTWQIKSLTEWQKESWTALIASAIKCDINWLQGVNDIDPSFLRDSILPPSHWVWFICHIHPHQYTSPVLRIIAMWEMNLRATLQSCSESHFTAEATSFISVIDLKFPWLIFFRKFIPINKPLHNNISYELLQCSNNMTNNSWVWGAECECTGYVWNTWWFVCLCLCES